MKDLNLPGAPTSIARGINKQGQVVGNFWNASHFMRAFLWQDGTMKDLGTLPGGGSSNAFAINDSGQVVGWSTAASPSFHAFLWQNGEMKDLGLGTLGGVFSQAFAINNQGEVVGGAQNAAGGSFAFLWQNGTKTDLNTFLPPGSGWVLSVAYDINDRGEIVGTGLLNGQPRSFLLQRRRPVLIIPGIAGTYADDVSSDQFWILHRGVQPELLQIDPLARVYHDLIKTLENVGYVQGKDLFVVNYDWRLPPGPSDGVLDGIITGITAASITDGTLEHAVDYLGVALRKALDAWEKDHPGIPLPAVDVITHSTGGLVARTYIQSAAYGGTFGLDRKLPKIANLIMVGVPNRGASKAWNPLHDNWAADMESQAVLSKIINRAYQKVLQGKSIAGPDLTIDLASITDPATGALDPVRFIRQYVPTIGALLATYLFLDCDEGPPIEPVGSVSCGAAVTHVNGHPDLRNSLVLDLNAGFDFVPAGDRNAFADRTRVTVIYGDGTDTPRTVRQRVGPVFAPFVGQIAPFTDFEANDPNDDQVWYEDVITDGKGDGTVPLDSSVGQFTGDGRVTLVRFAKGDNTTKDADHLGLMHNPDVQKRMLQILGVPFKDSDISTDLQAAQAVAALSVLIDPVEGFVVDALGRRLGFSAVTGPLTEIPGSVWFGNTDGIGWVFGPIERPLTLQLSGLDEPYYVMVSVVDGDETGGLIDQGFLAQGQPRSLPVPVGVTDVTPPVITVAVTGTLGNEGWYVSDVRVAWQVTDPESAIVSMTGCDPVTIAVDTPGVTLVCEATSAGGTAGRSVRVKRDVTPPVVRAAPSPAANAAGWHNTDVMVVFTAEDATSGVAGVTAPVTVTTEGAGQRVTGTGTDRAGNAASASVTLDIDKTPPTLAGLPGTGCSLWPPNHRLVRVAAVTASDALSGLAPGAPVVTGASSEPENGLGDGDTAPDIVIVGGIVQVRAERSGAGSGRTYRLQATATDVAGNVALAAGACVVPHNLRR